MLIAGAFFIVMVAGIMVAINLTQVGKSKAGQSDGSTPVVIIEDQDFTVEKSIPALEIKIQTTKPGTLYFRKVKALPSTSAGVTSK